MSIHEKLAARLRELAERLHETHCHESKLAVFRACESLAEYVESGDFDDVLGVREPTIEDVKLEAARVFGAGFDPYRTTVFSDGWVLLPLPYREEVRVPSISAAYAALRTLEDFAEGK